MNLLSALEIQRFRDQEDTPLHAAAYAGDIKKVKTLLRNSEVVKNIDQRNRLGCSPLRLAATGGHLEVIELLLQHGAEPNLSDIKTQSPLYVAVKKQYLQCVNVLLQAGAHADGDPRSLCTPIYLGAMDGWLDVIKALVEHGADLNRSQINLGTFISTPLYITIVYRHLACFQYMLRAGAHPDAHAPGAGGGQCRQVSSQGQSLYHTAIRHSVDVVFVEELYAFGASLNVTDDKGRRPHEMQQRNECYNFVKTLYDAPRTLLMQCRIQIRKTLGRHRLASIQDLPLPSKICMYLQHE